MKKIVALLLAVSLVAGLGIAGAATFTEKTIDVKGGATIYLEDSILNPTDVNGKPVDTFIYDGTTYLPVRAVSEALGMDVDFDLESGSVYVDDVVGNAEKAAEYLEYYFGVTFEETVTTEAWNTAVAAVNAKATAVEAETLTVCDAIASSLDAAGLTALVGTYTAEKAAERIAAYGVPYEVSDEAAAYVAAALDAEFITANTDPAAALDNETAEELLMAVVQTSGKGRNYIGRISDGDILSKVMAEINSISTMSDATVDVAGVLSELGPTLIEGEVVTGYSLKYSGNAANFLPEYTIQYGHSSASHAVQLISLLASKGIDAYIQVEPKTSIFYYGSYSIGNEYDMQIEFDNAEDRLAFDGIVKEYAQKYVEKQNEDGSFTGLISGAWWTPMYSSTAEVDDQYTVVSNNIVKNGEYEIHTYCTNEQVEEIAAAVAAFDTEGVLEIVVEPRYTNNAFAVDYLPEGETVLEGAAS